MNIKNYKNGESANGLDGCNVFHCDGCGDSDPNGSGSGGDSNDSDSNRTQTNLKLFCYSKKETNCRFHGQSMIMSLLRTLSTTIVMMIVIVMAKCELRAIIVNNWQNVIRSMLTSILQNSARARARTRARTHARARARTHTHTHTRARTRFARFL